MWHPRVERRAHAVLALSFQCALVVPLLPFLKPPFLFFPGALLEDLLLLCGLAALLFGDPEPLLFSGAPLFLEKSICLYLLSFALKTLSLEKGLALRTLYLEKDLAIDARLLLSAQLFVEMDLLLSFPLKSFLLASLFFLDAPLFLKALLLQLLQASLFLPSPRFLFLALRFVLLPPGFLLLLPCLFLEATRILLLLSSEHFPLPCILLPPSDVILSFANIILIPPDLFLSPACLLMFLGFRLTLCHFQVQLAVELVLCQRSNLSHALLEFVLCAFATAFRRLRVENGIAYCLSLVDHVFEVTFDTPAQVALPLVIRFNDATVCANLWRMWWRC